MEATAELQMKLQRRLKLQREADTPSHLGGRGPARVVLDFTKRPEHPDERRIREQIELVAAECREAWKQKQSIEASAVANGIVLGAEVARMRIEVEVLKRELSSVLDDLHRLHRDTTTESRRQKALKEHAAQLDRERDEHEARRETLLSCLEGSIAKKAGLEEKVQILEEDVHKRVVERVRLESMLRASEVRETELRRLLEATESHRSVPSMVETESTVMHDTFTMDDSDSESDKEGYDKGEEGDGGDLEFCYEGLELMGVMSFEKAMQLAQRRDPGREDAAAPEENPGEQPGSQAEAPSAEKGGAAAEAAYDEAVYEAPLQELQAVLSRITSRRRGPSGKQGASDESQAGAEPKEEKAVDEGAYGDQLDLLQAALDRISAAGGSPDRGGEESSAHGVQAVVAKDDDARSPEPPAAMSDLPSAPAASPMAAAMGIGLFFASPYAKLGAKYSLRFVDR